MPYKLFYIKAFVSEKKQLQIPLLVGVLAAETLSREAKSNTTLEFSAVFGCNSPQPQPQPQRRLAAERALHTQNAFPPSRSLGTRIANRLWPVWLLFRETYLAEQQYPTTGNQNPKSKLVVWPSNFLKVQSKRYMQCKYFLDLYDKIFFLDRNV